MDFKNQCQIINVNESSVHLIEFWDILGVSLDHIVENKLYDVIHLSTPIVYKLVVGSGYIELPQIELTNHNHNLTRDILKTDSVYIIDCWDEIFVWCGKKTVKMLKEAAKRLAYHLLKFFTRISYGNIQVLHEGYENFIFKSYFYGWEDTLKSQFDSKIKPVAKEKELWIKSSQSVKLLTCENFNLPKMEITSIFLPRQTPLSLDHCQSLLDAVDEYLEHMDCFVFENKKFIKLPEIEKGQFYSNECYVFLCKIVVPVKDFTISTTSSDASKDGQIKMELKYKVFFWEGRCCQRTGYLTFAFSLKKQFEECFGDKLIIERISQQQEPYEFLALFHPVLIIHRGYRPSAIGLKKQSDINFKPRLYQIRNMMGYITLRCVEIDLDSELLCSRLFYILTVPPSLSPSTDDSGHIYLWMGNIVDETEKNCAQLIVQALNLYKPYPVVSITEGNEPNEFWSVLGGKKSYDVNGIFIDCCRLFRCSNETGFFGIKEKYIDFCQDDLINSDVMLLDNGVEVFLWEGCSACDIEIILTRKLVSTYVQNCKLTPGWLQRKIIFIKGGEEPIEFRKVFQGFERQSISAQMLP
uniref:Protein flightless-1 homolog (Trinotate prediction) n=1 Tax=Henneguya salminicola TaxID=69463 RepID=A0A6G3ME88_HENSL